VSAGVGDANGRLLIEVTIVDSLAVGVKLTGTVKDLTDTRSVTVAEGQQKTVPEFSLDSGGPFNDRAYFRGLTIRNVASPAI